jgi:hypothetical protein
LVEEPLQCGPDWVGLVVNVHVAHRLWAVCLWVLDLGPMLWAQGYMCNSFNLIFICIFVNCSLIVLSNDEFLLLICDFHV